MAPSAASSAAVATAASAGAPPVQLVPAPIGYCARRFGAGDCRLVFRVQSFGFRGR